MYAAIQRLLLQEMEIGMNSKEIAKLAGVSRSTVSRVINNYSNVPDETREKVLEVIKQYNYVPHASARMLAGGKNRRLGLFIVDMDADLKGKQVSRSYYFSPFTSVIIDNSNKMGYTVVVSIVSQTKDFDHVKQLFYDKTINGGIFIGVSGDEQEIKNLIAEGYKVVLIDQYAKAEEAIYSKSIIVNADNMNGAYEATKYLIGLGHREIVHVTGGKKQLSSLERLEGYRKALNEAGIPVQNKWIVNGNFKLDCGYKVTKKILSAGRPTAIFYSNDSMAIGGIQAIEEAGLQIPEDISIIGFDDVELAKYLKPGLTTVRMDLFEMASVAINALINVMENEMNFSAEYVVPVELMVRGSCKELNS